MSAKRVPWTKRPHNQPAGRGRYAIVKGKAYPSLEPGRHPTGQVNSLPAQPSHFYHEPAVKLSEGDLDDLEGVDDIPLCYEHNQADRVGTVAHSWLNTDQGQCLKVWARIPLEDEQGQRIDRGHQIVAEIKAGKIKGLSVGYGTPLAWDHTTQTRKVSSKLFREISLVKEPFFNGCDLTVGVLASADAAAASAAGNLRNKITLLDN